MEKQCEGIGQPVSVDLQVKKLFDLFFNNYSNNLIII